MIPNSIRNIWLLPISLGLFHCAPQENQVINRNHIDFLLSQPVPLHVKARRALFPSAMERAFKVEGRADLVAWYSTDGRIRIDSISGKPSKIEGSPNELSGTFDQQRKKSLIVVVIAKQAWPEAEERAHIDFLNRYFLDHGYRRVVIQQARGYGRPTHSDISPGTLINKALLPRHR